MEQKKELYEIVKESIDLYNQKKLIDSNDLNKFLSFDERYDKNNSKALQLILNILNEDDFDYKFSISATELSKTDVQELAEKYINTQIKILLEKIKFNEHLDIFLNSVFIIDVLFATDSLSCDNFIKNNTYFDVVPKMFQILQDYRLYKLIKSDEENLNKLLDSGFAIDDLDNINYFIDNFNQISQIIENLKNFKNQKNLQKLEKRTIDNILSTPIDRINSMFWNKNYIDKNHKQPLIHGIPTGELQISVGKGLKNSDQSIFINFDLSNTQDYQLSKNLDAYDFLVYVSIANLWSYGNVCVSLDDIYKKAFISCEMNSVQKQKLVNSIEKLMKTQIAISNTQAIKHGMKNYTLLEYKGSLLPGALTKRAYRGRAVDCFERSYAPSYKILPLFDLAIASNNAIITLPDEAYILPFTATERNLQLRNYLMTNILAEHKNIVIKSNGKSKTATKENRNEWKPKKLKLETLYKAVGVTKENIEHTGTLNREKKTVLKNTEKLLKQWSKQERLSKYEITEKYLTVYY